MPYEAGLYTAQDDMTNIAKNLHITSEDMGKLSTATSSIILFHGNHISNNRTFITTINQLAKGEVFEISKDGKLTPMELDNKGLSIPKPVIRERYLDNPEQYSELLDHSQPKKITAEITPAVEPKIIPIPIPGITVAHQGTTAPAKEPEKISTDTKSDIRKEPAIANTPDAKDAAAPPYTAEQIAAMNKASYEAHSRKQDVTSPNNAKNKIYNWHENYFEGPYTAAGFERVDSGFGKVKIDSETPWQLGKVFTSERQHDQQAAKKVYDFIYTQILTTDDPAHLNVRLKDNERALMLNPHRMREERDAIYGNGQVFTGMIDPKDPTRFTITTMLNVSDNSRTPFDESQRFEFKLSPPNYSISPDQYEKFLKHLKENVHIKGTGLSQAGVGKEMQEALAKFDKIKDQPGESGSPGSLSFGKVKGPDGPVHG